MYRTLGYEPCDSADPEPGFDRVALYIDTDGVPMHAARQLPNGRWTSKIGDYEDIEHALEGLQGRQYGQVARILRRPR